MRMTFNKTRQLLVVSAASLLAAGLMTACGTQTTDFVFVSSAKAAGSNNYGVIDVFEINAVSGFMRQIPTSPFPSGGRNPVAEAVSSDNTNLYVVNQDDNNIVQFKIGSDGKLYPQNTVNTPGIYPLAVAVNGSNLYVVDTYQPLTTCSTADPCSGSIGVFPIETSGALGTAVTNGTISYWPLTLTGTNSADIILPTGINVLTSGSNTYVYVTAYDTTNPAGYVFAFQSISGKLSAVLGSPFAVGTHPSAIASDSTGSYVYVTDSTNGNVHGYSVLLGALSELSGSPFPAGNQPSAIVADPKYPYLYVANAVDGQVEAYSISSNGRLGFPGGSSTPVTYDAGLHPVAIGIDPSTYHFLFTANFLGNDVSNFELNTDTGALVNTQRSPYAANSQPTAVAAIPHRVSK
jgi:6-phosphogluconolactonase (cycloisomerase 2 family)